MSRSSSLPVEHWRVRKEIKHAKGGVVAAQNARAAAVGVEILAEGGNAMDAAVATAMALAVVEPWMSGLGGCGFLMTYEAKNGSVEAVDFGTAAPADLDPSAFGLAEGAEKDADLFGWERVRDDRNVHGPLSIGVPGTVAGLALALERFGRMPWKRVLEPAVAFAREGHVVDWWSTLKIAGEAATLCRYDDAARVFLPDGLPPVAKGTASPHLDLSPLADTLEQLSRAGAPDFYKGDIAQSLAEDMNEAGAWLSSNDLNAYSARLTEPHRLERAGSELYLLGGLTAGPTFADALSRLGPVGEETPRVEYFGRCARSLWDAYEHRLRYLGHDGDTAGQGSTTHLSVADSEGNLVALTNTLLSLFGSKVLSPRTGIMMNNGVMWFDPRPGGANSLAPGARPLCNISPLIATRGGAPWFALGGSGGRRILPAVFQVTSFLVDLGMRVEEAVHHPRINVDGGGAVEVDPRLGEGVMAKIGEELPAIWIEALMTPNHYGNPLIAGCDAGTCFGAAQTFSPVSAALGCESR